MRCLGTEDRVKDTSRKVPASHGVLAFVAFPGSDIKDLYLHDYDSSTPEPPAPEPPKQQQRQPAEQPKTAAAASPIQPQSKPAATKPLQPQSNGPPAKPIVAAPAAAAAASAPRSDKGATGIGTGEHLLHLRVKKNPADHNHAADAPNGVFDFAAALSAFNKTEVMDSVAKDPERSVPPKALYKKDDFFDSLSCDVLDREMGRRTHMTNSEERNLNQDTFGAVSLQSNYSRGRRYNNAGGGRGAAGRGQSGFVQQQGRGGRGGGGGSRGGSSRGGRGGNRGGRGSAQHHNGVSV